MSDTFNEDEIQLNSGVECPGNNSLEPYIGSLLTLDEKNFIDENVLVEIAESNQFTFKYKK